MKTWLRAAIILLAAALALPDVPALAQDEAAQGEAAQEGKVQRMGYAYDDKGRRDPFLSLIEKKKIVIKTGIPLQDFDVSQMWVVGIVVDAAKRYALFGLPDGKFYTVSEGETIGIHGGKVESIMEDAVLIREFKPDFRGRLRAEDTYLRLRQEEGL